MTRSEAINTIAANLSRLDEEELKALVEVTNAWAKPERAFNLTEEERAAIERSFDDFKAGRTLTLDESEARTDAFLRERRVLRSAT
jgi:hypothetical protein